MIKNVVFCAIVIATLVGLATASFDSFQTLPKNKIRGFQFGPANCNANLNGTVLTGTGRPG